MRKIPLKDAKAKLSTVVDQAARGKPSVITRRGRPEAVVLGFTDWQRLSSVPSFGRLLMAAPLERGDLPERRAARHGRSTEAEHREILRQALSGEVDVSFDELAAKLRKLTKRRKQTPSEILLRESRAER